jgi:hypothetical protein
MVLWVVGCGSGPSTGAAPQAGSPEGGSNDGGAALDAHDDLDARQNLDAREDSTVGSDAQTDASAAADSTTTDAPAAADSTTSGESGAGEGGVPEAGSSDTGTPVWTNRYNNQRTGATSVETQLAQANVAPGKFGLLFSRVVDGTIQAQPLYVPQLTIQGAKHNVVFVATFNDSVYAFDADDPAAAAPLWVTSLGPSVPYAGLPAASCMDILPEIGVTSTPVIDVAAGILYTTAKTLEGGAYVHRLHALDILTGHERAGSPVTIHPTAPGTSSDSDGGVISFDVETHLQRPGLLLEQGVLYIAFGSHCDSQPYHGWVLAYDAASLGLRGTYVTTPTGKQGGIWQSGTGLSTDGSGVFFVSGNGDYDPAGNGAQLGLSVGRLTLGTTGLRVADFWTPTDAENLNENDDDLTTGPIVGPGNLLFAAGKVPVLYVLNRTSLGGFHAAGDQIVQTVNHLGEHTHGGPVYWEGPSGAELFFWPESGPLQAFGLDPTSTASPVGPTPLGTSSPLIPTHPGGMVTVSSNGTTHGSGVVWASVATAGGDAWHSIVPGTLYAFSAEDVSQLLWSSDLDPQDRLGLFAKFCPPTVVNGRLYIGTAVDPNVTPTVGALRVYGPVHRTIPQPMSGLSYELVNRATSWVADVQAGSTTAGAPVVQWPIDNGANQSWTLQPQPAGGFTLLNALSNMVLDVPAPGDATQTGVDVAVPTGSAGQQWTLQPAATPGYFVVSRSTGGVVLTSPSTTQGDLLVVSAPNGTPSQEWQFVPLQ